MCQWRFFRDRRCRAILPLKPRIALPAYTYHPRGKANVPSRPTVIRDAFDSLMSSKYAPESI